MLILVGCKFILCKYIQIETITMLVMAHFIAFIGFDSRQDSNARCSQETVQYSSKKTTLTFMGPFLNFGEKHNKHLAHCL